MAAVLVAAGLWVNAGVRQAASAVTQGQAMGIAFAARRAVRPAGEINAQVLHEILDELAPQGLRYVEVLGPDRSVVAAAGKRATDVAWSSESNLGPNATIAFSRGGSTARFSIHPGDGPAGATNRQPGQGLSPAPPDHPLHGKHISFEVDSAAAHGLASRARVTLAVSLLAALRREGLGAARTRSPAQGTWPNVGGAWPRDQESPGLTQRARPACCLKNFRPSTQGAKGPRWFCARPCGWKSSRVMCLNSRAQAPSTCEVVDPVAVVRGAIDIIGGADIQVHTGSAPAAWPLDRAHGGSAGQSAAQRARSFTAGQPIDVTLEIAGGSFSRHRGARSWRGH
jgi:hypothetical protein